jgi:hypothetical protein
MTMQVSGISTRKDGNVMDAHRQWASRPADEAVFSVGDLVSRCNALRENSREIDGVPWSQLSIKAAGDALYLTRGNGALHFNHYSLGQFCALPVGRSDESLAPHEFVSRLSAQLASDVLNERLARGVGRKADATLLVQDRTLRAITTDAYERTWYADTASQIQTLCARGNWGPAEAFKRAGEQSNGRNASTTSSLPLGWVGDRSMFVCLVDYSGVVHSDGNTYARFVLLSDSEVGAAARKMTFGFMDFACCNFILWGCKDVVDVNFRHTKSIHDRLAALSQGMTRQLTADTQAEFLSGIKAARGYLLGDKPEQVIAVAQAATSLPKMLVTDAFERARKAERYGDPRSVWGMVNGLTEASQASTEHADKRAAIDAKAAQLMGLLKR